MATFPYYRLENGFQGSLSALSIQLSAGIYQAIDSESRPSTIAINSAGMIRAWENDDPNVNPAGVCAALGLTSM